ncbi:maleylpyruvate isomerase family mycothiol-dependent enzyme [Phycicoccus sonneratiae]|uniref:Maleylpyruvate isomerase family mycothiol-dependent enzyme n=1 Tax=Phycicoccus sonneratiae TaxID=2807628 RepID=A0ABS2CNI5_9MICO|nr:maleylpyruvate isomerase family mycothiol-dependent enzyme [Phycicoccus sonneraticus]MBM6401335.1 maleylpyruvate isomerase family mycothiol-dependent enzyme [Phycicoccus sonneraticus]
MSDVHLSTPQHLGGLELAVDRLGAWAEAAGPDAPVPTCPGWTVRELVVHQGAVHRWATAMLRGGDPRAVDIGDFEGEGAAADDLGGWLRAGAADLLDTLRDAPDDLEAFTFLKDAPPARLFWARRQHHETTVHALDALAALERRAPEPADAWFDDATALDGIDELLVGFWPRRTKGPRAEGDPYRAVVSAADRRWLLDIGSEAPVVRELPPEEAAPVEALVLEGSPVEVYLALWNRGGAPDDPAGLLGRWSHHGRIT